MLGGSRQHASGRPGCTHCRENPSYGLHVGLLIAIKLAASSFGLDLLRLAMDVSCEFCHARSMTDAEEAVYEHPTASDTIIEAITSTASYTSTITS